MTRAEFAYDVIDANVARTCHARSWQQGTFGAICVVIIESEPRVIMFSEQRETIREKKKTGGETAGARLLLDYLIEKANHPHLFGILRDILTAESK
jgi:hypothetical protein